MDAQDPPETQAPTEAPAESSTPLDPPTPTESQPLAEASTEGVVSDPVESGEPAESSDPYRTLLRIGLGTQLSAYQTSNYELVWWAGLHVAVTFAEWISLGLRELGAGYASDRSIGPGGVLFLELAWRLDTVFDLHASAGGHMQAIIPVSTPVVFGFAPVAGLGARFWAHPNLSIGLDAEVRWTATNTFHAGVPVVPYGTVLVSGGLSVCAHL